MPSNHSEHQNRDIDTPIDSTTHPDAVRETIRLPLVEETLEARVVEREQGSLRIHRRVETESVQTSVDLRQDRYVVERTEINELTAERREPWYEGDTLAVPVYEEVLVTETRLMLREVIRLHNAKDIEQVNIRGTLRREVIDIEERDSQGRVSRPEDAG